MSYFDKVEFERYWRFLINGSLEI